MKTYGQPDFFDVSFLASYWVESMTNGRTDRVRRPAVIGGAPIPLVPRLMSQPVFQAGAPDWRLEPPEGLNGLLPKQAEGLFAAKTNEEIVTELGKLLLDIEFDSFIIGLYAKSGQDADGIPSASVMGKVAPAWLRRYEERGYLDVDPRIRHCISSPSLFTWDGRQRFEPAAAEMFEEAATFGIRAGISCPILTHDGFAGLFSVSTSYPVDREQLLAPVIRGRFLILRDYLTQLIITDSTQQLQQSNNLLFDPDARLSAREAETLLYTALGMSIPEVSDKVRLAESTVRLYLSTAKARLGARNLKQAVALAVKHRLIPFPD